MDCKGNYFLCKSIILLSISYVKNILNYHFVKSAHLLVLKFLSFCNIL